MRRLDCPINQFLLGGHEAKVKLLLFFVFFSSHPLLLLNPYASTGKYLPPRKKPVSSKLNVDIFNGTAGFIRYFKFTITNSSFRANFTRYLFTREVKFYAWFLFRKLLFTLERKRKINVYGSIL